MNKTTSNSSTSSVVACIDGSRYSQAIAEYAAWLSLRLAAPLTLLHNLEHSVNAAEPDYSGAIGLDSQAQLLEELTAIEAQRSRLLLEQGKQMLSVAKQHAIKVGVEVPLLKQRHDGLTESLIAMENSIQLLVLGIRGEEHDRDEHHLGGHLESSIRALHRPILVVNNDFHIPQRILLAYDGSAASIKALDLLTDRSLFTDLEIHLVTIAEQAKAEAIQSAAIEKLVARGHQVVASVAGGEPSDTLHQYQVEHEIDLTIMGAFSHTRLHDWVLGSMTVKMLLSSSQPLLLLR